MNLELREHLDQLRNNIDDFLVFVEEHHSVDFDDDSEYTFLEDESGLSNTELDNFVAMLEQICNTIEQLA